MFQERKVIRQFKNLNLLNNKVIKSGNTEYSSTDNKNNLNPKESETKSRDISKSCFTDITKNRNIYKINSNKTVTVAKLTPSGQSRKSNLKLMADYSQSNIGYKGKISSKFPSFNSIEDEYNDQPAPEKMGRTSVFKIRNFLLRKSELLRNSKIQSHHKIHKTVIEIAKKRESKVQWIENEKPFTKNHESQNSNWIYNGNIMTTPNIESTKYGIINNSETKKRIFKDSIKHNIHRKTKSITSYFSVINAPKNNQKYMNSMAHHSNCFHKSNGIASSFILKQFSFGPSFALYKKN